MAGTRRFGFRQVSRGRHRQLLVKPDNQERGPTSCFLTEQRPDAIHIKQFGINGGRVRPGRALAVRNSRQFLHDADAPLHVQRLNFVAGNLVAIQGRHLPTEYQTFFCRLGRQPGGDAGAAVILRPRSQNRGGAKGKEHGVADEPPTLEAMRLAEVIVSHLIPNAFNIIPL